MSAYTTPVTIPLGTPQRSVSAIAADTPRPRRVVSAEEQARRRAWGKTQGDANAQAIKQAIGGR